MTTQKISKMNYVKNKILEIEQKERKLKNGNTKTNTILGTNSNRFQLCNNNLLNAKRILGQRILKKEK